MRPSVEVTWTTDVEREVIALTGEMFAHVDVDVPQFDIAKLGIPSAMLDYDLQFDIKAKVSFEWNVIQFNAFFFAKIDFSFDSVITTTPEGFAATTSTVNITGRAEAAFPCQLGHAFVGNVSIDFEMVRGDKYLFKTDDSIEAYFKLYCGEASAGDRIFDLEVSIPSLTVMNGALSLTDFEMYATGYGMNDPNAEGTITLEGEAPQDMHQNITSDDDATGGTFQKMSNATNATAANANNVSSLGQGFFGQLGSMDDAVDAATEQVSSFASEETNKAMQFYSGREMALAGMISGKLAAGLCIRFFVSFSRSTSAHM